MPAAMLKQKTDSNHLNETTAQMDLEAKRDFEVNIEVDTNIEDIRQELARLNDVAPLEGERYANCLHTYEAASNQRKLIREWFTDHAIPQLPTDNASILSIGCGAGELDKEILAAGKEHTSTVSYVGL